MNTFSKAIALTIVSTQLSVLNPITEKELFTYTTLSGVGTATVVGGLTFAQLYSGSSSTLNKSITSLVGGSLAGGLVSILVYALLSSKTPKNRVLAAEKIFSIVHKNKFAHDNFNNQEELFSVANRSFNVRWPIASAHESCTDMEFSLHSALDLLDKATHDTQDKQLLIEIDRLETKIYSLIPILVKHARQFQLHPQYEIQALLLDGYRREERLKKEAEERHREAMAQQERLHREAMAQQKRLLNRR